MESGYRGLRRAEAELDLSISFIDKIRPEKERLADALRRLAGSGAALVIAHGGQNNAAAQEVAAEFPAIAFAVTQGNVAGENLASYDILQEQSAWLAGAAAGMLTRTGVVGHVSGIRVTPGLKGRAAFADGLRRTNPRARLLTTFCGSQDDVSLARKTALAEIDAGADILFTMLNAGIPGVIDACRARGVRQIGNVVDWVARHPDVFVGSAIADVGQGLLLACRDHALGRWKGGVVRRVGLEEPGAVRLALAAQAPAEVRAQIDNFRQDIVSGAIRVPESYEGPELIVA